MEKPEPPFDICIVCALPEEMKAFLDVVRPYCQDPFQEYISSRYGYTYRFTTMKNEKNELLRLHASWLPHYGPQEMTLHLSHVLEECQPRIAIMTGICAGDAHQHVQLGDLVVAERTFTYDNGKYTSDDDGRPIHLYDTMTYQIDASMLQFLGLFTAWKRRVSRLKRPEAPPGITLTRRDVVCHIKPMASGSAVREDRPFADVQAPVRGTVAIDMEGAAFGLVMRRHPWIRWLVVKSVCDYADQNKSDGYHRYAARASALYALSFIRAYVTTERLPRLPRPFSPAGPAQIWNVPHARNPHFTGRTSILHSLRQALVPGAIATALTQAISGLGGIGKTQVAVEYAHQYAENYQAVLWLPADTLETLIAAMLTLATQVLGLPEHQEADRQIEAIKHWLQTHQRWLLILDNVEEPQEILPVFLPSRHEGSVLITTRRRDVGKLARAEVLPVLSQEEGVLLLLRRAERIGFRAPMSEASEEDVVHAKELCTLMDGLPLALDQAGAYIAEHGGSLRRYRDLYERYRPQLLDHRAASDHPDSALVTLWIAWDAIAQRNALAGQALAYCAFLAPEQIPESLVHAGLAMTHEYAIPDPLQMEEALGLLYRYSLVERREETLWVHRVVQDVIQEALSDDERQQWMKHAIYAVAHAYPVLDFPSLDFSYWPTCERLLPHALICATWIEQEHMTDLASVQLLERAGSYLDVRSRYHEAEPLLLRALAICEQQPEIDYLDRARSLKALAMLYENQGKLVEAEELFLQVLTLCEQRMGSDYGDLVAILNNLAELYRIQGRYTEADRLLVHAITIGERKPGTSSFSRVSSLTIRALLYWDQFKYTEAEPLFEHALALCEGQFGPDHLLTAEAKNGLAMIYLNQGEYEKAEELFGRAFTICEQQFGPDHLLTTLCLNNVAELYRTQEKCDKAEKLFKRALATYKQLFGADHLYVAVCLNNMAGLYTSQRMYGAAEPLYQRALAIREQHLAADHSDIVQSLNNLAMVHLNQGEFEKAKPLAQRAHRIYEQLLGVDHLYTTLFLNNLAGIHREEKNYTEAEPLLQRALAICEKHLGPNHLYTAVFLNNLAELYHVQGNYAEAEPLSLRLVTLCEELSIAKHLNRDDILNWAGLLLNQGKKRAFAPQSILIIREQPWQITQIHIRALTTWLCFIMGTDKEEREVISNF